MLYTAYGIVKLPVVVWYSQAVVWKSLCEMSTTKLNGNLTTETAPWFVGKMERVQAEQFLMEVRGLARWWWLVVEGGRGLARWWWLVVEGGRGLARWWWLVVDSYANIICHCWVLVFNRHCKLGNQSLQAGIEKGALVTTEARRHVWNDMFCWRMVTYSRWLFHTSSHCLLVWHATTSSQYSLLHETGWIKSVIPTSQFSWDWMNQVCYSY